MALNLRHKQKSCIVRMLHLNSPNHAHSSLSSTTPTKSTATTASGGGGGGEDEEEFYKVLIVDKLCRDVLSPLIHMDDLRKHGVTRHLLIDKPDRQPIPDAPAVYFVQPTAANLGRIASDAATPLYQSFHLNFSSSLPRPLLEELASSALSSDCVHRFAKIHDQYLHFVTLLPDLFSLALPTSHLLLNDPSASELHIESAVADIVSGLFCVLATLSVVPIIRCPRDGPSEMVAHALDSRLRDHLLSKNNLFSDPSSSFQRPILCLFDRNFDLTVPVQHDWTYRPLVHDVLGLHLNLVSVRPSSSSSAAPTRYELDDSDPFWLANASAPFPKVAEEIESQLAKYKQNVDEVNRRTAGGGGDPSSEYDGQDLIGNTKHLMTAVNSLPELTERKKVIDKHTNIATVLLSEIKERSLDAYCNVENDILTKGTIDRTAILGALKGKGTQVDKLRLAIIYLLSAETTPAPDLEAVEAALREAEVDTCAFQYVKKIKSLNMSLANSTISAGKSNIVDWAEKLYGQSISAVAAGMKNLLSGGRQLPLTRTVEALMEGKPNPEVDNYLVLDPRAPKSSSGMGGNHLKGPFKEAIVFMIGGGNYVEYGSLQEFAQRQQPAKHVVYGTTELLTGVEFVDQLTLLGQKMGLGSNGATPTQ